MTSAAQWGRLTLLAAVAPSLDVSGLRVTVEMSYEDAPVVDIATAPEDMAVEFVFEQDRGGQLFDGLGRVLST